MVRPASWQVSAQSVTSEVELLQSAVSLLGLDGTSSQTIGGGQLLIDSFISRKNPFSFVDLQPSSLI